MKALVIGNGESRSWFKPCHQTIMDKNVVTWGCNAIYRDGPNCVHNLVAMDYAMQQEIYEKEHLDRQPRMGNMWANINPPGGMNAPHIHPNALFSGVYYVKSSPKAGRLKIYDPRPGIQFNMPIRKEGDPGRDLWRDANIEPIPGRIIMFPAWLWHAVEENISDDIRISVSFNFIQEGFNG